MAAKTKAAPKTTESVRSGAKKEKSKGKGFYNEFEEKWSGGGGGEFWKIKKQGRYVVRFLPFETDEGPKVFVKDFRHFNCPGEKRTIVCGDGDCPICDLKGDVDGEVWLKIKPAKRVVCNAVTRPENKLVIAQFAPTVRDKVGKYLNPANEDLFIEDALDPTKGVDFIIIAEGEGLQRRYDVTPARRSTPLGLDDYQVKDLLALQEEADPAEMKKVAAALRKGK